MTRSKFWSLIFQKYNFSHLYITLSYTLVIVVKFTITSCYNWERLYPTTKKKKNDSPSLRRLPSHNSQILQSRCQDYNWIIDSGWRVFDYFGEWITFTQIFRSTPRFGFLDPIAGSSSSANSMSKIRFSGDSWFEEVRGVLKSNFSIV